jgi:predicted NAD-dependent protein-ADP-ribosyltransferase YbiA (DUF1768 family)
MGYKKLLKVTKKDVMSVAMSIAHFWTMPASKRPAGRFKAKYDDEWNFLSNLWPHVTGGGLKAEQRFGALRSEHAFLLEERRWETVEHYYQWHHYQYVDPAYADHLVAAYPNAYELKKAAGKGAYQKWSKQSGSTLAEAGRRFDGRKTEWWGVNDDVMRRALRAKFTQNRSLAKALVATGDTELSEQGRGKGEHWTSTGDDALGRMLMELRSELR